MYMEGKDGANISALGEWEDGGDVERIYGRGSIGLKEKIIESPWGRNEFEVFMGHAGGDQKMTRPWRLKLLAKLLVQASA